MTALIERLRGERMDNKETWLDYGREEGKYWIENCAQLNDIQIVINNYSSYIPKNELTRGNEDQKNYFNDALPETLNNLLSLEDKRIRDWDYDINRDYDAKEYQYFQQGWMEAVKEIWEEIKYDVEE